MTTQNNFGIKTFLTAKHFRVNPIYANIAKKEFIKNTTSKEIKKTLAVQKFWNKVFSIEAISSFVSTSLKGETVKSVSPSETNQTSRLSLDGCEIDVSTTHTNIDRNTLRITADYHVVSGSTSQATLNLGISIDDWQKTDFLCAPGASYNAGRFEKLATTYPPFMPPEKQKKDIPIITSVIPGLDIEAKSSQMDLLLTEMTSPIVGVWLKEQQQCLWIDADIDISGQSTGFTIKENQQNNQLTVELMTPPVRQKTSSHGASAMPSWDQGGQLKKGDTVTLSLAVHSSDCCNIHDFYQQLTSLLQSKRHNPTLVEKKLPLSASWQYIEKLYNQQKWSEHGYYHAGFLPPFIDAEAWSAGWTGGLALSFALLANGNSLSQERAIKNLEFFFSDGGQSAQGIFYATSDGKSWGGDDYFKDYGLGNNSWLHVRRCGDYLYFAMKHIRVLDARNQSDLIRPEWLEKTRKCASALCKIWKSNKHFGQYINPNTLDIRIGNSDAGNIIPAALADCAAYFGDSDYMDVAKESAEFYFQNYVKQGFTCGGPLEVLNAPDCESAANLLESLVVLHQHTGDSQWTEKALSYCDYIRTWFYTYDVSFPDNAIYNKLNVQTTGSVMASSQNRCAVPNLCTLSGDVFLKLFRQTGDTSLLQIIQECVHNTQQYLSRKDNPIVTMTGEVLQEGTIHECIQTGDWSGPPGEIPYEYPTSWTEVANLLSIVELPGIYLVTDEQRLFTFDHLDVVISGSDESSIELSITNPTQYDSHTRLLAESSEQRKVPLPYDMVNECTDITVKAGESLKIRVER
ncbi:hypothetical protein CS022_04340 [Veronia nyctiphanis]|uniref:Uncharacterized protein n=1 Tax=Veronia nyctiphanis TaxID=1278244 RepID=A0A4Q0YSQ9_9GAMM|nr:hypothetical protein [Veronia nyctiphanis]RXJ74287.1 hypothetical protein CS022_04340 [Veronia nyctiphanis]